MGRSPCCEKVGLRRGKWTKEEDQILTNYVQANGEGSWRSLPKNAGLLRCGKSCRLRWINYLRTDLKRGNFSVEEEDLIIKLHGSHGNRWSLIASHLPGRTDNEIKNYWISHLRRRIFPLRSTNNAMVVVDIGRSAARCRKRGGRKSPLAMKKNSTTSNHIKRPVVNKAQQENEKVTVEVSDGDGSSGGHTEARMDDSGAVDVEELQDMKESEVDQEKRREEEGEDEHGGSSSWSWLWEETDLDLLQSWDESEVESYCAWLLM